MYDPTPSETRSAPAEDGFTIRETGDEGAALGRRQSRSGGI